MNDFWIKEILWGVAVWRLIAAIIIIFLGFLCRRLITALFRDVLKRQVTKTDVKWDDELVEVMPKPVSVFFQILLWYGAVYLLVLPKSPVNIQVFVTQGLQLALCIAFTWAVLCVIDVVTNALSRITDQTESKLDDQLMPMIRKTLKTIVFLAAMVMIIQNLGYSVTSMIASLGVGGLALALAAKDTVANVFGSVIVFTDRPFQVGDWVQFSGIEGTVEEVGFRTTQIRRFDKSQVTVPNAVFSSTPIVNHSRRPIRRISMDVGLSYETNAEQMRQILEDIRTMIKEHPDIDSGFHFVNFVTFGDSSLNIRLYCFSKTTVWKRYLLIQEDVMLKIMELVEARGLEIAFPTRTVYLRDEQWNQAMKS